MTDLIILAALLDGPAHGYVLKRSAGLALGRPSLHNNLVYPLLHKFIDSGWVVRRIEPGERGRERKLYALTREGRRHLLLRLERVGAPEAAQADAFRLRVGLFDYLSPEARRNILGARKAYLNQCAANLAELRRMARLKPFAVMALDRAQREITSELRWMRVLAQDSERAEVARAGRTLLGAARR